MYICRYCGKGFKKKYNLNRHQRTTIYCLEKQKNCDNDCTIDSDSEESPQEKIVMIDKIMALLKDIQTQNNNVIKDLQQQNNNAMKDMQQQNKDIMKQMLGMIDAAPKSKVGIESLAESLLPITDDDLAAYLDNLSLEFIFRGVQGYADYAGSYPFKGKLICTDKSRKKIQYKNEDGNLTTDGRALAQRFFQAIEEKNTNIINKEYTKLQCRLQNIIDADTVGEEDVSEILKQASFIQNMLMKIQNAAQGKDDEFVQMFLSHLSKKV